MERFAKWKNWIVTGTILGLCSLAFFEWDRRNYLCPEFLKNHRTIDDLADANGFQLWLWWAETKPWEASEWLWKQKKIRLEKQLLADLVLENTIWKANVQLSQRNHLDPPQVQSAELKFLGDGKAVFSRNLRFNELRIPLEVKVDRQGADLFTLFWEENRLEFVLETTARRRAITKPIPYSAQCIRDQHSMVLIKF